MESLGNEEAIGMDDALSAEFISVSTILKCGREQFSFDHYDILWDWFKSKKLI